VNGVVTLQSMRSALLPYVNMMHHNVLFARVVLTKDNLAIHIWHGDKKCCFCSNLENIQHLLFYSHVAKFLWRVVHFGIYMKQSSSINHVCLMTKWSGGKYKNGI
jgi:hypothetical protein